MKTTCSRGHTFEKGRDSPVCPMCRPGYCKEKNHGDFPNDLSVPALKALLHANIFNLKTLAAHGEAEIAELHGMGPNALEKLKEALYRKKLSFKIKT